MTYDMGKVNAMIAPYTEKTLPINLSEFVKAGYGVCRHQGPLAALMIEALTDSGQLRGTVGVRRNHEMVSGGDGHAWAVYRDELGGPKYNIDPTNDFVGDINAAWKRRMSWSYKIHDDPLDQPIRGNQRNRRY